MAEEATHRAWRDDDGDWWVEVRPGGSWECVTLAGVERMPDLEALVRRYGPGAERTLPGDGDMFGVPRG